LTMVMDRRDEIRQKARKEMERSGVLMTNGHFDYGNGFHGRVYLSVYLNPHQLFQHPSTIWRLAQDVLDIVPSALLEQVEVVAGPPTGGALLAHTIAGLLDGRPSRRFNAT
jgi:orotate phosphoribosyltransferase